MRWDQYPGAPAPGTPLCAADFTGARTVSAGAFGAIVIRGDDGALRGFVNLCPHQFLPLDYRAAQIVSADGARLICSSHQAQFDAVTGEVCAGPAECGLSVLPLQEAGGQIIIGDAPAA
ncbi:MAG: Rieske (2Fe-2S) protein [Paracoccus sp. (in: a-proteobacteria)]|nr:Rieske (2Fe-2S) protein [Paracoccus sp. (in: a-proteobacteria)]